MIARCQAEQRRCLEYMSTHPGEDLSYVTLGYFDWLTEEILLTEEAHGC